MWLGETLTAPRVAGALLIALSVGLFVTAKKATQPAQARACALAAAEVPEP